MRRVAPLLWLAVTLAACAHAPASDVLTVDRAALLLASGATPPDAAAPGWQPVALPDRWTIARRRVGTEGWYRVTVHLDPTPAALWAVYLPRLGQNVALYVNGHFVGDGGRFDEPLARNWNRPLLFAFPSGLLVSGDNTLLLRLKTERRSPVALAPFSVGPAAALRPLYERQYLLQVTLTQVIAGLALAVALVVFVVFVRRDPEGSYLWFGLAIMLWAWTAANGFVRDIPMPSALWEWSQAVAIGWLVVCFVHAFHRALGVSRPRLERALLVAAALGSVGLAIVPDLYFFVALIVWVGAAVVLAGYVAALIVALARRSPDRRARLLLVPGVVALVFGLHDVLGLVRFHLPFGVLLSPYIIPLAMVAGGWLMLGRLVDGLDDAERLNRELEGRVREKREDLAANYERLRTLERAQAVVAERDRIMRDMHDGMGGQLVSTLALVDGGHGTPAQIAEALRDALDDLRLVIDSLDPLEGDLLTLLGAMRARLEPRLGRHGIHFDWQVADLPPLVGFGPERALQALRIVQEAVTNVVKHAGASTITVRTGEGPDGDGRPGVFVEVSDDGCGIPAVPAAGRGLVNMRRRASALGGSVSVTAAAPGTRVRLWLPLATVVLG